MLVDWLFFHIFNFIGSSVIYLSLSEIPIWNHQWQFGLSLFDHIFHLVSIREEGHLFILLASNLPAPHPASIGGGGQQFSLYDFFMCDNFSDFQALTYVRFGQHFWRMGWSESRSQYTTMPQGR
jgi:hypothetical protein